MEKMKIKKLKINGFGTLENKEIELGSHLTIIHGNNESGKSTLQKFILAMFYGVSRNKNGKFKSDYERYIPWKQEEYSGKISYELENGTSYEVFREFKKKAPKIFNEKLEDISQEFNIDKTNGNEFFKEQTNLEEETFLSTIVSEQGEIQLGEKEQISLVQKLSNLMGTGEESVSFQKIIGQLNKRQLEKIGTQRSQDRPMNVIQKRLEQIQNQKEELYPYQDKKYRLEEQKQEIAEEKRKLESSLEIQKQIQQIKEKEEMALEKIKATKEIAKEYQEKIETIKQQKMVETKENVPVKKQQNEKKWLIIAVAFIILAVLTIGILQSIIGSMLLGILAVIFLGIFGFMKYSNQKQINEEENNRKIQEDHFKKQIQVLEQTNKEQEAESVKWINQIQLQTKMQLEVIQNTYRLSKEDLEKYYETTNSSSLQRIQEQINEKKIQEETLRIEKETVLPKLENLVELEEEQETLEEQQEALVFENECIELAKQEIQKAYEEMKQKITPKFTQNLSKMMSEISQGAYTNVKFDEEQGIIVEIANGDYISAQNLSIGTMDQLYLSLRLSAGEEISQEPMPIMLDEAFAYYDTKRLENILTYLDQQYPDRQILIFTCSDREKEILKRKNIEYVAIELE